MVFFRSEDHLERWIGSRSRERGAVLTLADTWRLAQAWYPDRRQAAWRPRTRDESQAILDGLALDPGADFWTLK